MQVSIFQHHGSHLGNVKNVSVHPVGSTSPVGFSLPSSGSGRMALGIFLARHGTGAGRGSHWRCGGLAPKRMAEMWILTKGRFFRGDLHGLTVLSFEGWLYEWIIFTRFKLKPGVAFLPYMFVFGDYLPVNGDVNLSYVSYVGISSC